MMLVLFVISIMLGILIITLDRQFESSKWLASIIFTTSAAAFAIVLYDTIAPLLINKFGFNEMLLKHACFINAFLTQLTEHLFSYLFLMYCISTYDGFSKKLKGYMIYIFLLPPVISFFHNPILSNSERRELHIFNYYYTVLSIWSVSYLIFGTILLIQSYQKEKRVASKKHKGISLMIVIPIVISIIPNMFILRALGTRKSWQVNGVIIIGIFVFFIVLAFKYGAMGIKLRAERQNLLVSLNSISQGTSIFNHTLKNEVIKMSIGSNNIKYNLKNETPNINDALHNLEMIDNSLEYLQKMITRIHDFSGNIKLVESTNRFDDILEDSLANLKIVLEEKSIRVEKNIDEKIILKCDKYHITEVFINIIKNACEAMSFNGEIRIQTAEHPMDLSLTISDNGPGISKEYLSRLFEPFFTTKKTFSNFGLGLSYCYKVIRKHDGDIIINSTEGMGTSIELKFPQYRISRLITK